MTRLSTLTEDLRELTRLTLKHLNESYDPGAWLLADSTATTWWQTHRTLIPKPAAPERPLPLTISSDKAAPSPTSKTANPALAPSPKSITQPHAIKPKPPLPKQQAPKLDPKLDPKPKANSFNLASHPLRTPPTTIELQSFDDIHQTIAKTVPHLKLLTTLPDDSEAKKRASQWQRKSSQAEIILLITAASNPFLPFLRQIESAIQTHFAPACLVMAETIEKSDKWSSLLESETIKWIISPMELIESHPLLSQALRHENESPHYFLGSIRLTPLPSAASLQSDTAAKRAFWNQLKSDASTALLAPA